MHKTELDPDRTYLPQSPLAALLVSPLGRIPTVHPANVWRSCPTLQHALSLADIVQSTIRNFTVVHFTKRFLESAFVHDFSRATVPFSYIVRKYAFLTASFDVELIKCSAVHTTGGSAGCS